MKPDRLYTNQIRNNQFLYNKIIFQFSFKKEKQKQREKENGQPAATTPPSKIGSHPSPPENHQHHTLYHHTAAKLLSLSTSRSPFSALPRSRAPRLPPAPLRSQLSPSPPPSLASFASRPQAWPRREAPLLLSLSSGLPLPSPLGLPPPENPLISLGLSVSLLLPRSPSFSLGLSLFFHTPPLPLLSPFPPLTADLHRRLRLSLRQPPRCLSSLPAAKLSRPLSISSLIVLISLFLT